MSNHGLRTGRSKAALSAEPESWNAGRVVRIVLALFASLSALSAATSGPAIAYASSATARSGDCAYDVPVVLRDCDTAISSVGTSPPQLSCVSERSASPPNDARRASTTLAAPVVATEAVSPVIDPAEVAGMSPAEVDAFARENGLIPKGPDPAGGKGAYVDPVTGEQRILCHPDGCGGGHLHVNDPTGQRLDIGGNPVAPESPAAHLPGMFSPR